MKQPKVRGGGAGLADPVVHVRGQQAKRANGATERGCTAEEKLHNGTILASIPICHQLPSCFCPLLSTLPSLSLLLSTLPTLSLMLSISCCCAGPPRGRPGVRPPRHGGSGG